MVQSNCQYILIDNNWKVETAQPDDVVKSNYKDLS